MNDVKILIDWESRIITIEVMIAGYTFRQNTRDIDYAVQAHEDIKTLFGALPK